MRGRPALHWDEVMFRGEEECWGGGTRTDTAREKNTEGDMLERQKCESRGREIRGGGGGR